MEGEIERLQSQMNNMQVEIGRMREVFEGNCVKLSDSIQKVVAEAGNVAQTIVGDAGAKFQGHEEMMRNLAKGAEDEFQRVKQTLLEEKVEINQMKTTVTQAFDEVKAKINEMERDPGGSSRGGRTQGSDNKMSGYLPTKNMLPKTHGGKVED